MAENKNFGVPQISKFIDNLALFDGKEESIQAYSNEFAKGIRSNLAGYDIKEYPKNMAKVITFEK